MAELMVKAWDLGKQYRIGARRERYQTVRDRLAGAAAAPFRKVAGLLRGNAAAAAGLEQSLWALREVSFEVRRGEALGIIGHNGAGKSTLLKILSRITSPTTGGVDLYGRVASLLEVGTGFHPELTGRENVYLNGSILGMKKREIDARFDELVAFSEVERFLDTPVKHYSSGMRMRLAFAVAAHLEPEILVIDEVLAVGDAAFQAKCTDKMGEVARGGRTVLFVSHNLAAVQSLCDRAITIDRGRIVDTGDATGAVERYLRGSVERAGEGEADCSALPRRNPSAPRIAALRTLDRNGSVCAGFAVGEPLTLEAEVENVLNAGFNFSFAIENDLGVRIYCLRSSDVACASQGFAPRATVRATIPELHCTDGTYVVSAWLRSNTDLPEDELPRALRFGVRNPAGNQTAFKGAIAEKGTWSVSGKNRHA